MLAVVNQGAEPWRARVPLRRTRADGTEVAERTLDVAAAARWRRRAVPGEQRWG
ncbi:hypothetical protein RM812_30770 [Streptomyces sp. DSM 40712]|uniref:Uncharacterized protein n=1 Tax=Streptomyces lancefieldiae TaxID=3075520 RepID=A0ABU3AWJ5_9ACTN|nr:hypothetical protein [Streptomyces sp. DSM 40712]